MARDAFATVPTVQLWAAALCGVSLGMSWNYPVLVRDVPIRLFIVGAGVGLLIAALRPRTPGTRRLVRTATVALTVALALALGHGSGPVVLVLAFALVLAGPPAWRSPSPAP
jgi:hypothetical protein